MLATARSVIVDEIHAVAPNKRGAHLSAVARAPGRAVRRPACCASACRRRKIRSARWRSFWSAPRPADRRRKPAIIDTGHQRRARSRPGIAQFAARSGDVERGVDCKSIDRLARLIEEHRTTLVFVNTRRMAERVARELSERLGEGAVTAHHGSMAKEHRLAAEQRLKRGRAEGAGGDRLARTRDRYRRREPRLPARVAAFDRRLSAARRPLRPRRRRHAQGPSVPAVARRSRRRRGADRQRPPRRTRPSHDPAPTRSTCSPSRSSPKSRLRTGRRPRSTTGCGAHGRSMASRSEDFDAVARMLAEGFATRHGPSRRAHPSRRRQRHVARPARRADDRPDLGRHDPRHRRLSGRARAREPCHRHGQRGFRGREHGRRRVPARQRLLPHPPGRARDGPGRGRGGPAAEYPVLARRGAGPQRRALGLRLAPARRPRGPAALGPVRKQAARRWLIEEIGVGAPAAEQLVDYLAAAAATFGCLPTQDYVVLERFFDEAGGMQLVVHAPFGSRINRAWGLALRKRFCRKFNFELQAAATEDNIVLVADRGAQLRTRRRRALSSFQERAAASDPGDARRADVRSPAGAGSPASRSPCRGSAAARRSRRSSRACRRRT